MTAEAQKLAAYCASVSQHGSITMMGIDFGALAQMFANSNLLLAQTLQTNANTGLGLAYNIQFLLEECAVQGLVM